MLAMTSVFVDHTFNKTMFLTFYILQAFQTSRGPR